MIDVVIITNRRCPALLEHIIWQWHITLAALSAGGQVHQAYCPPAAVFGDALADAMNLAPADRFVIIGHDDVLPIRGSADRTWRPEPSTLTAMRMLDVEGRRWFDWAYYEHDPTNNKWGSYLQDPEANPPHPHTYITGGAQVWSPEARKVASYRGKPFGSGDDMQVCWEAALAGIKLVPPAPSAPLVIHLERRYPGGVAP